MGEVKELLWVCERDGARAGVRRNGGDVDKIPHIDNELLKHFDVQSLHREISLAQEKALVVGGKGK